MEPLAHPMWFEALLSVPMLIACDPNCRAEEIEIVNATPDPDDNPHCAAIVPLPTTCCRLLVNHMRVSHGMWGVQIVTNPAQSSTQEAAAASDLACRVGTR
ncbi:hypothetical protein B0T21DRAFT_163739 [Apiosordaria backusii]|uniref:Uncharacterized protein n=1 Tax=Apiosordaria backusii TaxID=314023 RepID=A0AA40BNC3_9PEZI|nr:hypothetical protein B0T21DRAFT_163739 [Apiosordaria backusii]